MDFNLRKDQEYIELYKLLKTTNLVGTGGEAKILISEGAVLVNGEEEYRKRYKVRSGDFIEFDGKEINVLRDMDGEEE